MFAEKQRDRGCADDLRRPARQPCPRDRASQAQHVEHRRLVPLDARGKHIALPRARGRFDAIELRDRLAQPVEAQQTGLGLDVLPDEKESHEIGWTDRRDLGAEAIQRVAMDACEQPSITPFQRRADLVRSAG